MALSLEERVAELEAEVKLARDKQDIYDSLMRYCRGIDRCVPEVVQQVWPSQSLETCTGITDWLRENTVMTMHYVGNCLVKVDGDQGETEAYMIAYHTYDVDGVWKLRVKAGRDFRTWQRTDDGWVTTDRDFRDEWNWFVPLTERAPGADAWTYGERGIEDPAFHVRESLGKSLDERRATPVAGYPGLKAWK
jgi:SnoaL-like domain